MRRSGPYMRPKDAYTGPSDMENLEKKKFRFSFGPPQNKTVLFYAGFIAAAVGYLLYLGSSAVYRANFHFARFGPDNDTVAFVFCPHINRDRTCRPAMYNFVTKSAYMLEGAPHGYSWYSPSYSWDRRKIALQEELSESDRANFSPNRLVVLDLAAKTSRVINQTARRKIGPVFSPDDRYVYYYGTATAQELQAEGRSAPGRDMYDAAFDLFRTELATGREERVLDADTGPWQLAVSRYGLHHKAWVRRDGAEGLYRETFVLTQFDRAGGGASGGAWAPGGKSGFSRRSAAVSEFGAADTPGKGIFVYDLQDDPFFNARADVLNNYLTPEAPYQHILEGAAKDGRVLISLPSAGAETCKDGQYAHNLFIVHPEGETRRVTDFECAYFGFGLDISPDGGRVLVHVAPHPPGPGEPDSMEKMETRNREESVFYVMNSDGTGAQTVEFSADPNAYETILFQRVNGPSG